MHYCIAVPMVFRPRRFISEFCFVPPLLFRGVQDGRHSRLLQARGQLVEEAEGSIAEVRQLLGVAGSVVGPGSELPRQGEGQGQGEREGGLSQRQRCEVCHNC